MTSRWQAASIYLFAAALSLTLSLGCGRTTVISPSPIIAVVNEHGISLEEFQAAFLEAQTEHPVDEESEVVKELKRSLLNQLIEHHLFLDEARRMNLTVSEEDLQEAVNRIKADYAAGEFETMLSTRKLAYKQWEKDLREGLLTQRVIVQAVPENIEIPDAEVKSYYKANRKEFIHPEEVRARQLVVSSQEEALAARQLLLDQADFAELALKLSLSGDKEQGGDLGFFALGEMPEAFDIAFKLDIGEISPVVKSAYGYHIFKVEERHPASPLDEEEAAQIIRANLTQVQRESLFQEWVRGLQKKAQITINYQILYQPLGLAKPLAEASHG